MFLQYWRLDVQHQGASRVDVWLGLSSWLVDGHILSLCILSLCSRMGRASPGVSSSSYKDTSLIGLRLWPYDLI